MPYFLGLTALGVTLVTVFLVWLNPIARRVGLVDRPSSRKTHDLEVPLIGGISISLSLFLVLLLSPIQLYPYREFFFSVICLVFVGIFDDSQDIQPKAKLIAQLVVALVLVIFGDFVIKEVGDIWDLGYSQGLGILAIPFTVLYLLATINACNMIDGHDGVLGSVALVSFLGLAYLLYRAEERVDLQVILLCSAMLIPFILFNLGLFGKSSSKVFLGDSGSMFLGIFLAFFAVKTTEVEFSGMSISSVPFFLGLPLLDFFGVIILRLLDKKSIWRADRYHLHHFLHSKKLPNPSVFLIMVATHSAMVFAGIFFSINESSDYQIVLTYIGVALGYICICLTLWRARGRIDVDS